LNRLSVQETKFGGGWRAHRMSRFADPLERALGRFMTTAIHRRQQGGGNTTAVVV
jgi:hypothetical protein